MQVLQNRSHGVRLRVKVSVRVRFTRLTQVLRNIGLTEYVERDIAESDPSKIVTEVEDFLTFRVGYG